MAKFENLKAVFEITTSNNKFFEKGDRFVVKRVESGAFAYGDRSAHTIDCNNEAQTRRYYDTRYAGISTNATIWRNYWKKHIENEFDVKIKYVKVG